MKKIFYTLTMLVSMLALTSCEQNDSYLADLLRAHDWEGDLGAYYQDRWRLSGSSFHTVMHFTSNDAHATSGRGIELDYDKNDSRNYASCEFSWSIVNSDIILIYDDNIWAPVYIHDYRLYSNRFTGRMDDGTRRDILFDFTAVDFQSWNDYSIHYSGYHMPRRGAAPVSEKDSVPVIANGKSILSGVFAEAAMQKNSENE